MEHKIIISGSGGQGVLFAGIFIANAAMMEEKNVTYFPSYGAEIRGGAAMSSVIISDEPIGSPVIDVPNTLIILNEVSFKKYTRLSNPDTIVILNTSIIKSLPEKLPDNFYTINASDISMKKVGDVRTANVVMIGYWAKILAQKLQNKVISINALQRAANSVSKTPQAADINVKALMEGYNYESK